MPTEEEAREAADGKEVQVEAMDLEPFHMQTHLDRKLSSMEIKNMRENIDSTEGTLKNLEDKVLVEAPSEIKLPPEHNLNGTTSLNVHMDEENKISNEQLHEDNKKDHEQVEVVENTSQNDKMNNEVNDCLSHGQATTEDSSLLKHEKEEEPEGDDQQDEDPMQDISTKDSDVDRSQIAADRLDHNLDLAKAIEDTQPASMANIPDVEVVAEAHAGVQSPLASDAILDTIDGSNEKDESARVDDAIHHEHRESFPEDTSTAKHTEVVKAENQQNKQDGTMDEEDTPKSEQEDISKCDKTGVFEETPNSAHADGSTVDAQEVLHQEPSEETNGPAYEKQEKTSQQSSMATSDDTISEYDATTCEPPVDTQVHHKESLEEMEDAEAVDTKEEMKQSCAALEEVFPEYHVATTQQDSVETNNTEISETHNAKITPSSGEDKVENNVTARGPTNGDQEVDNAGSTEEIRENIAENNVLVSNVATTDEANKENNMLIVDGIADKHMRGIEPEVTNNTQGDSDQRHVSVLDDSAQEDNTPVSENQQMVSALEIHETEATRTKAVSKESNASVSQEPSPEEYVTESETTRGAKEVNTTESLEAIEGDKDTQNREISNQSNMDSPGKLIQENNAPESETTSDIQPEQESKEMKDTDLVQVNETYPQINATIFQEQTQENNPTTSELHVMESEGGTSNIEATEEQATPHQLGGDHSEEKATEEIITSSEPQALESVQKMNDTEPSRPDSTPQQIIVSPSEESVLEEIAKENIVSVEPDDAHQQPLDPELAELDEIETNISVEVMEDTEYMKSHGALAGEAAQEENVETEASVDISSVQEPELEEDKNTEPVGTDDNITSSDLPAKRMEKETMEIEAMPHNSPVTNITEVTENNVLTAIAPHADIQPVLEQESVEDKCTAITDKLIGTNQIVGSASDELTPTEDNTTMAEPACDTPLQNVIAQEIKDSEDDQTDQFSMPDSFHIPGESVEESKLPRIEPTSVVLEVQELGSTEETRGIKMVETEDHQQQIVSTLEELTEDYKPNVDDHQPNVDDHQVHEEKSTELKDNEAMEAEEVLEKSNITTLCNAPEERSELINDPDCYVQTAQQVESSTDSEHCKLVKEEETSDQQFITLEHTTQDSAADEIDLPIGMEQEHELESVEEVKDISANKAKHDFHSSQPDALNKLASESNTATTESTKETKSTEGINDEDMACEQTELATSVDSSPKVNEIAPQEHLPPHEENLGNKTYSLMLAQGMKDGLQTSAEQKDDAFDLGETAPNKKSKNKVDEDAIQSSGEDTLETSKSTDQIKERQNDGQDLTQDKDINGEPVTERGTAEASQALIANDAQASQDVMEKDDTIKSGEQTNDQRQSGDVEHRLQTCESPAEDEAVQKINLDERHEEDKEVEPQKQQLPADEQKHKDERDDVGNKPLVESKSAENGTTNRTEEANTLQDPIDVPYSAESGEHEDKECTNKVNDDLLVIQSAKEIVAGTQENKEMQNEAKAVHAESQTKAEEEEEMSQLHAKEPHNLDTKVDDAAHGTEIIHDNTTVQPREIEKMGEDTGLGSIYKPVVETSEQNNVEQDFSIHHKAEDEKQESTEDNAVELEAPQQKATSNVDTNNDDQLPISRSLTKHISESADDVLQLETEGNAFDKADECEKTEASNNKSVPETVTFNEEIRDMVTGAEGGLSDESLETFDDTRRNLDAPSVVTASNEGGTNEEKDEHKLDVPAHPTIDENTPEQEMFLSDKPLPAEPEEQEDDQILKEQDEEDMYKPDFGDDQKEVEQDLPVSNFLMNLILGKENSDANGHSEPEAETKQEETRDDNSCLTIPKQEENLVLPPTKNHMEDQDSIEQEKKDAKCSEETHEVVEEQSHDLKLGTETSLETDAELNKDSHHLELPPHQDKMQDEISNEILSEEAAEGFTKIEAKDIAILSIKQDDGEVSLVCQENTEAATQIKNESLNNNVDDLNNTKLSEEDTLGEGQTGLLPESLNDDRSVNAVSEQTLLLTESGMIDAKSLQSEAGSVQNPVCEMQDKTIESSSTGATSIPDTKVENEEDKTDEKQPATTATGEVAEEHVEISNDNPQNSIGPEATSFEQEPQIVRKVSYTEKALGSEKEISEGSSSTFMDKKEDSNVSVKGVDNIQTDVAIQADNSNMQINQDKQEATDNKTEMESEKLEESNIQEQQENGTGQKSPKECHEEDQKFLAERETLEEDVNETVKNHMETINIKSNDEQELSDSKVQERDLNVFSPKDVCEPEESFVEITKPEFRTDEEQSPKADPIDMSEQKTYEGKTKGEEKIRSFTDEETTTEAPAAEQKAAHKKQNLLSGVGSKVKHQLAKVKKAITGKPGHTKPESPK